MNIVLIIVDTLRYDHIGVNGNPEIHTPNLDRLAKKSWNFHRAFASSFPTIPHRTDVMTGRYGGPFHPWKPLDCDKPTIPRALAEKGYCSQLIHDTPHLVNGGHSFDYPFDAWTPVRGGEVDRSWITDKWEYFDNWFNDPLFDGFPMSEEEVMRKQYVLACYMHTNKGRKKEEDWNAAKLFLTASEFLRDNQSRDNFFLWIDCFDPHEPWDAPPEFMKMYDKTPGYDGRIDPRSFQVRNNKNLSEAARNRVKAMYKAKVSFVDKWLGRFLDTLEETGLDKKTAIILTADHGTNVGDRDGNFGKSNPPIENESHVPFMLCVPNAGGGESQIIVQPQDIFATVMAIAGNEKATPEEIESYNVLKSREDNRNLALGGSAIGNWPNMGTEKVLFSAFDKNWRLGFAVNPEKCELQRLGTQENVARDNPKVVDELHKATMDEIIRRNLYPSVAQWLKSGGKGKFPENFRITDANPAPKGWRGAYWMNIFGSLGMKS